MTSKLFAVFLALSLVAFAAPATNSDILVSSDWLSKHLADPRLVLLHVAANRNAYDAGHVPGARFVSLAELAVTRDGIPNELPPVGDLKKVFEAAGVFDDSHIVIYSDTSVLPATRAYFTLDYLGQGDHAALLDGGLEKWRGDGRTLSKDLPAPVQGNFTPRPKPNLVAQIDEVRELASKAKTGTTVLDVRAATDYRGEKGGHIPGAVNVNWMDGQASRDSQVLRPEAELRKLYEAAGVTSNRPVITYCNSGMQASQAYFTLKYLGYDARVYDGSMSEWNAKGAPVEK